jgi:hypothetical protein
MFKEIEVPIEDLLLDPNNPRFINDLREIVKVHDAEAEERQEDTLRCFSRNPTAKDPDFDVTNIKDLYESMLRIGFVGIDLIVVRPIKGSKEKYLVLEGNRRVAAVKSILHDYEKGLPPLAQNNPQGRDNFKVHEPSYRKLPAMILDTEGLSDAQIEHNVAVLLGIRHHGSVLEWDALPKAFNIYSEYMGEQPIQETFKFENKKVTSVANRLCIDPQKVMKALRTYQAYLQVREHFTDARDSHFSLIESAVQGRHVTAGYFNVDQDSFELDEQSLSKLNAVCQFSTRDSKDPNLTTNKKKKILPDPKHFNLLGKLIDGMQRATQPAIKAYAADLIQRAENEEDLDLTLRQAVNDLTSFMNKIKWAEAVAALLDKREKELPIDQYAGDGLDRGRKDELKATLEPLRKIMAL